MRTLFVCSALLFLGQTAYSQSLLACPDDDSVGAESGCTTTPDTSTTIDSAGTLDEGATSAIPSVPMPKGMAPLVVPDDPLRRPTGSSPLRSGSGTNGGGSSGAIGGTQGQPFGNSGITSR